MSHISRADAEILATFVRRLRPPAGAPGHWNQAGTIAAIQACRAPLSETAVALIRLAEDATVRTPGLLNEDGHWWYRAARGEQRAVSAPRPAVTCPLHTGQPLHDCAPCKDAAGPPVDVNHPPQDWAATKAQLEAKDYRRTQRPVELTSDVSAARARADMEATS